MLRDWFIMRRFVLPTLVAALCLSGVVLTADALVTTDEERLDRVVDDVTAPRLEDRVDGALNHISPSEVPLRLSVDGQVREFAGGDHAQVATALRGALSVFDSERQEVLQRSVDLEEKHARIVTRVG